MRFDHHVCSYSDIYEIILYSYINTNYINIYYWSYRQRFLRYIYRNMSDLLCTVCAQNERATNDTKFTSTPLSASVKSALIKSAIWYMQNYTSLDRSHRARNKQNSQTYNTDWYVLSSADTENIIHRIFLIFILINNVTFLEEICQSCSDIHIAFLKVLVVYYFHC